MTPQPLVFLSCFLFIFSLHAAASVIFQVERPLEGIDSTKARELYGNGEKYFRESSVGNHYDSRFTDQAVTDEERCDYLRIMIRAYFERMADIGVESWIMHGSLLGWWWNQKIMPWDEDLDVQVSEASLWFLWDNYNFSVYDFDLANGTTRSFMLEVNPNFKRRHVKDRTNRIDARWIDVTSGLFIDLTAVRKDYQAIAEKRSDTLMCKDKHRFAAGDIFPLRRAVFEGLTVNIPYAYTKLLLDEYGEKALINTRYLGYNFNQTTEEWGLDPNRSEEEMKEQQNQT